MLREEVPRVLAALDLGAQRRQQCARECSIKFASRQRAHQFTSLRFAQCLAVQQLFKLGLEVFAHDPIRMKLAIR